MNLNSCEIHRLDLNSFFNGRRLWRSWSCSWNCCLLLAQRTSACSFDHLFVRLPSLCFGRLFALHSFVHSAVHSVVIVCARGIGLLFKLLFKLQNVLIHSESRSSFACNQNIKEVIPTALEVFLCSETKRNDINRSPTKTSTQRPSNIRGRTGYNV